MLIRLTGEIIRGPVVHRNNNYFVDPSDFFPTNEDDNNFQSSSSSFHSLEHPYRFKPTNDDDSVNSDIEQGTLIRSIRHCECTDGASCPTFSAY